MTDKSNEAETLSGALRKVLNTHGHGFQYAALRRVNQIFQSSDTPWIFERAEFPVVAGNIPVHIDFILRSKSGQTYLIAECKRADPAKAHWCFVRAPYTWNNANPDEIIFDQFLCKPPNVLNKKLCVGHTKTGTYPYHLALELKTGISGDGTGQVNSTINQAVTQVLRGTSGWINYLFDKSHQPFATEKPVRFIPVIFTTAQIWVTEADLGAADLTTGDLQVGAIKAEKANCIWFNYNRTPGLRPDLKWENVGDDLSKELKREFVRSITIVNPEGFDQFMKTDLETQLE